MTNQGDLFDSWAAAEAGAKQAADHADRVDPEWSDKALDFVQRYAELHPERGFLCSDMRELAAEAGLDSPPDRRAWGHVFIAAKKAGIIVKIGYGNTTRGPMHSCPRGCWRLASAIPPEPELRWPIRGAQQ